jgi:glyoxylase-like metal-dependent hydrolase (beta-lactamase superfamily II)
LFFQDKSEDQIERLAKLPPLEPKDAHPFVKVAREAVAPYIAAGGFRPFGPDETPLRGVSAVPTPGHTPGLTGCLFSSKNQSLLMWGDIVYSHAAQFARPEIAIEVDIDKKQAVVSRRKMFADAAKDKRWVAGAHLLFPGIGHVRSEPPGYAWVPIEYSPILEDR